MARLTKATKERVKKLAAETDLSKTEIARATGIQRSTVYDILQADTNTDKFIHFQANKDKIFESLQMQMIQLADVDTLKHIVKKRGFTDVAILQDKLQLLRNQPTNITDYQIRVVLDAIPNQNKQLIDVTPVTGQIDQSPGMDDALCNINALIDNSEDK